MDLKTLNKSYFVRIVKMEFEPRYISQFVRNFNEVKTKIRATSGCLLLELYVDKTNPNIFFTYSYWENEIDLENYRNSNLFKAVWAKTKPMFSVKPIAWSVDKIHSL